MNNKQSGINSNAFALFFGILILLVLSGTLFFMAQLHSENNQVLTKKEIRAIFNDLVKATGAPEVIPDLYFEDNPAINAYANTDRIVMLSGMINFVKSKDEMASVLAHEISHVLLDHMALIRVQAQDVRLLEANADKMGVYLMLRSGYDVCAAKNIWERMQKKYGNYILTTSHPSYADRVYSLTFAMCK